MASFECFIWLLSRFWREEKQEDLQVEDLASIKIIFEGQWLYSEYCTFFLEWWQKALQYLISLPNIVELPLGKSDFYSFLLWQF